MLDELLTNSIGGFGEIHVTGPGGDRLFLAEWTDGLISIERLAPWVRQISEIGICLKQQAQVLHCCQIPSHETLASANTDQN
jgi:hypothetical protein